jgi:glucose/arabinose dehydrogenase
MAWRGVAGVSVVGVASIVGALVFGCGGDDSAGPGTGGSGATSGSGGNGGSGGTSGSGGSGGGGGSSGSGGSGGGAGQTGLFDCSPGSGSFPNLKLTSYATGFSSPTLASAPLGDTDRLFVGERAGRVQIVKAGTTLGQPFLDIADRVTGGGERGLLGMAFHPDYATNGRFFVHYTGNGKTAPTGDTVISEFTASGDSADESSEKVLLTVKQPEGNHNGGSIEFRPGDGSRLYIALGDGGGGGDVHGTIGNGQALDTLLGKILRIDVDAAPAGGKKYAVPGDNMSGGGALEEIWSYGLRNPFRTTFDACTGDMYIGDVGQNKIEEIDVEASSAKAGTNWGWRVMEGSECFNPASGCDKSGKALPVAEYPHSKGCSVAGGYVYRGSKIPGLRGVYLYADYCSGNFWRLTWNGTAAVDAGEITSEINPGNAVKNISSFGQDGTGELYVVDLNAGVIHKIEAE